MAVTARNVATFSEVVLTTASIATGAGAFVPGAQILAPISIGLALGAAGIRLGEIIYDELAATPVEQHPNIVHKPAVNQPSAAARPFFSAHHRSQPMRSKNYVVEDDLSLALKVGE